MRSIKVLGMAIVAVLAFSAVAASSASALLFLSTNAKELFTVNANSKTKLSTLSKETVECETTLAHGFTLNKTDKADEIVFTFHKCKSVSFGVTCTSSGEPEGLIKTKSLKGLLVTLANGKFGIKLEGETSTTLAEFSCGSPPLLGVTVVVKGSVVGEFTEAVNKMAFHETNVKFATNGTEGMPAITSYETLEGKGTAKLESTFAGLINETSESAEEGEGKIVLPGTNTGSLCGS